MKYEGSSSATQEHRVSTIQFNQAKISFSTVKSQ